MSSTNVKSMLEARLTEKERERMDVGLRLEQLTQKMENAREKLKIKQKATFQDDPTKIEAQIAQLEFQRSTNSMSLAKEKGILRQQEQLKAKLKDRKNVADMEVEVRALNDDWIALRDELRAKGTQIDEISGGLARLNLAEKLGISPQSLVTIEVPIPADKIGQIVGKKRASLAALEQELSVQCTERLPRNNTNNQQNTNTHAHAHKERDMHAMISVPEGVEGSDSPGGGVIIITGSPEGCALAKAQLNRIASLVEVSMHAGEAMMAALRTNRFALRDALQDKYCARLDIKQDTSTLKIYGTQEEVDGVKADLDSMRFKTIVITVTEREIPALLGTKGSNLRRLEEEYGVHINLDRAASNMSVLGPLEGVQAAADEIRAHIEEHKEKEELVPLPGRHLIPALLANQAELLKAVQKEIGGVSIMLDRPPKAGGSSDNAPFNGIKVKGQTSKVDRAVAQLEQLLENLEEKVKTFHVSGEVIKTIVGKAGASIKLMRAAHPQVSIDVDWDGFQIKVIPLGSGEGLLAAVAAIEELINNNKQREVLLGKEVAISLRSKQAAPFREILTGTAPSSNNNKTVSIPVVAPSGLDESDVLLEEGAAGLDFAVTAGNGSVTAENNNNDVEYLGLSMDIMSDEAGTVKLRGCAASLDKAVLLLEEFRRVNYTVDVTIFPDDVGTLVGRGEDSLVKVIAKESGCTVNLVRERHIVRVRGERSAAELAAKRLNHMLYGGGAGIDDDGSVVVLTLSNDAMGPVIGKGGANVKEMEEKWGVRVDAMTSRHQIRIRGDPQAVKNARAGLRAFLSVTRIVSGVKINSGSTDDVDDTNKESGNKESTTAGGARGNNSKKESTKDSKDKGPKGPSPPSAAMLAELGDEYGVQCEYKQQSGEIVIRGVIHQVHAAQQSLKEIVSGHATAHIALAKEGQVGRLPESGLHRVETTFGVNVKVDMESNALVLTGTHSNVRKAKKEVYFMLEFAFPGQFTSFPLPRGALTNMGNSLALSELSTSSGGAACVADFPASCIRICGSQASVESAVETLTNDLKNWRKLNIEVHVEVWMLGDIVGKGGSGIKAISTAHSVTINTDRSKGICLVRGETEEDVIAGAATLQAKVDLLRKGRTEFNVPNDAIGQLIGAKGATLRVMEEASQAQIDVNSTTGVVSIRGTETSVQSAKELVQANIQAWQRDNSLDTMEVPERFMGSIIGKGGANIRAIQDACKGVRIDTDKSVGIIRLRGPPDAVQEAKNRLTAIVNTLIEEREAARKLNEPTHTSENTHTHTTQASKPHSEEIINGVNGHHVQEERGIRGAYDSVRIRGENEGFEPKSGRRQMAFDQGGSDRSQSPVPALQPKKTKGGKKSTLHPGEIGPPSASNTSTQTQNTCTNTSTQTGGNNSVFQYQHQPPANLKPGASKLLGLLLGEPTVPVPSIMHADIRTHEGAGENIRQNSSASTGASHIPSNASLGKDDSEHVPVVTAAPAAYFTSQSGLRVRL